MPIGVYVEKIDLSVKKSRSIDGYIFFQLFGPIAQMLHNKPQGYWRFGSGEEDVQRDSTIHGRGGHVDHVTQMWQTNFRFPGP